MSFQPKTPKPTKDIPAKTRQDVEERSGGVCEHCQRKRATNIHHRKYRSRGGNHDLSNLIHLCGVGNTSGCHGLAHTGDGERLGLSVPSGAHPQLWPVCVGDRWVTLLDERTDGEWFAPVHDSLATLLRGEADG